MLSPIQIILLIIVLFLIFKTWQKYKTESVSVREMFLWIIFWITASVLVIFPDATQTVANLVGIGRGVDLVIYLSLIFLFFGLFYVIVRLERIERDITKIVRKMAFDEKEKK